MLVCPECGDYGRALRYTVSTPSDTIVKCDSCGHSGLGTTFVDNEREART